MGCEYQLTDLFRDYIFTGNIQRLPSGDALFEYDVSEYDPQRRIFVATLRSKKWLAAGYGEVIPKTFENCAMQLSAFFHPGCEEVPAQHLTFEGNLKIKDRHEVSLNGLCHYATGDKHLPFALHIQRRGQTLCFPGDGETCLELILPRD